MKSLRNMLSLVVMAALAGCDDHNEQERLNDVESKIVLEVREDLLGEDRSLTLYAKTEKIYSCSNFHISTENTPINNEGYGVTFKGVSKGWVCATAFGPATAHIDFGSPKNGRYSLVLNNGSQRNEGYLAVTDDEIALEFSSSLSGIEFSRTLLKRVPEKTYWGHIAYIEAQDADVVDGFVDELVRLGAVFEAQPPGDYGYYNINEHGEIVRLPSDGNPFARYVIFQYSGDESALKQLVENVLNDQYWIRIRSYRGDEFRSRRN